MKNVILPSWFISVMLRLFLTYAWLGFLLIFTPKSGFDISLNLIICGLFVFFSYYNAPWIYLNYHLRPGLAMIYVAVCIFMILKMQNLPFFYQENWINVSFLVILSAIFILLNVTIFNAKNIKEKPVLLDFPLKSGLYHIFHGGSNVSLNYHSAYPAFKYAYDIFKQDYWGFRTKKGILYSQNLNDYHIFDDIVYSPCDGVVVKAVNDQEDMIPPASDIKNPGGNYLIIRFDETKIVLAHLKKGSLLVKTGETVTKGQPVARIGNSGNTSEPHLHIHAEIGGQFGNVGDRKGVPILFNNRFLTRNQIFKNKTPKNKARTSKISDLV